MMAEGWYPVYSDMINHLAAGLLLTEASRVL
jgi:hypothetical protein